MRMGPYAKFGIIEKYDASHDYQKYDPKKYNCVSVPDDLINDWWESLLNMKVVPFGYPPVDTTALDRWGVTIIPPESLPFFLEVITTKTSLRYENEICNDKLMRMLRTHLQ